MQPVPEVLASAEGRRSLASLMHSGLSLDAVAVDHQQATLVVANFRKVAGGR